MRVFRATRLRKVNRRAIGASRGGKGRGDLASCGFDASAACAKSAEESRAPDSSGVTGATCTSLVLKHLFGSRRREQSRRRRIRPADVTFPIHRENADSIHATRKRIGIGDSPIQESRADSLRRRLRTVELFEPHRTARRRDSPR